MIISYNQLTTHVCGSSADRKKLLFVHFGKRGAVSTNERTIIVVPYPEQSDQSLAEVSDESPILVHRDQCKLAARFAKSMAKRDYRFDGIIFEWDATTLKFTVDDQTLTLKRLHVEPISYSRVLDAERTTSVTFSVDPKLLAEMLTKARTISNEFEHVVTIDVTIDKDKDIGPLKIRTRAGIIGLAMPIINVG